MRLVIPPYTVEIADPDALPVTATFEVAELTVPGKSKGSRSNRLEVPMSAANTSRFGSNDLSEANDNSRHPFYIENGSGPIWQGTAIFSHIGEKMAEVDLIGDNANWFDQVKDRNLSELEMGETDTHSTSKVVESWNNQLTYAYFVCDYGRFFGEDGTYDVLLKYIPPAVRFKAIMDRIIVGLGYTPTYGNEAEACMRRTFFLFTEKFINLNAAQRWLDPQKATLQQSATETATTGPIVTLFVDLGTQTFGDPSLFIAPGRYKPAFRQQATVQISLDMTRDSLGMARVRVYDFTAGQAYGNYEKSFNGTEHIETVIENVPMTAGNEYGVIVVFYNQFGSASVDNTSMTVNAISIPWQGGVSTELSNALPKMKQSDFIKACATAFNLKITTDVETHTIRLDTTDEWYKAADQALNWRSKMDVEHNEIVKIRPDDVKRTYAFKCQGDTKDRTLIEFADTYGRGLGDSSHTFLDENMSGEEALTVPWAATMRGPVFEASCPILYKPDQALPVDPIYELKPRAAIFDGTKACAWTLGGISLTEIPEVYFVKEGSDASTPSLSFANNRGQYGNDIGLVTRYHRQALARLGYSRVVACDVYLNDEDVRGLDLSKPVRLRIRGTDCLCYLVKVEDYRFGGHGSTKCRFINAIPDIPEDLVYHIEEETSIVRPTRR